MTLSPDASLVERIVDAYSEMTGDVPPDPEEQFRNYQAHERFERLALAQRLDPSDMLFLMLLDNLAALWAERKTTTIAGYVDDPTGFLDSVRKMQRFDELMDEAGMPSMRAGLLNRVRMAIEHYGAGEREDVARLTQSIRDVPDLWMSAMTCLDRTLKIHQFRQGEPDGTAPLYQEHVLGFFSINDALRIGMSMPSGISMCMIRDADAIHSYFCFLVRNGGTLSIVTDQTEYSHPLQKYRSRRPDRHLDQRMGRSLFPYGLLDVQYVTDDEGHVVGSFVPKLKGIVPHQAAAYKMKRIADLEPEEIVWAAFMFGLLEKKFFRENHRTEKRSYTGEMIELPMILEAQAQTYGLPAVIDQSEALEAPALSTADLSHATINKTAAIRHDRTGHADWMEERYAAKVDASLLNRVAAPGVSSQRLLAEKANTRNGNLIRRNAAEKLVGNIHALDATTFGTAEQVLADRTWIARHNQAMEIQRLACAEFEERETEIKSWWEAAVTARKDALVEICRSGSLRVHSDTLIREFVGIGGRQQPNGPRGEANLLWFDTLEKNKGSTNAYAANAFAFGDAVNKKSPVTGNERFQERRRCCVTERPADVVVTIYPKVADDIAAILGIDRSGLPDVLRDWRDHAPYTGNSILTRLDPVEDLTDPWSEMNFNVKLFFSSVGSGVSLPERTEKTLKGAWQFPQTGSETEIEHEASDEPTRVGEKGE